MYATGLHRASQRIWNFILDTDMHNTHLYPHTLINSTQVSDFNDDLVRNGEDAKDPSKLGYFLINGHLVPFLFLKKLEVEFTRSVIYEPDCILSAEDIFSEFFLLSLDSQEREVLMPCVLLIIARGGFPLNLFAEIDDAY